MRRNRILLIAGACAILVAVALALMLVGLLAADDDPDLPARAIPAPAVLEDPQRYAGREITVTGKVDVLTDRVMSLGDEDLIVVATGSGPHDLQRSGFGVGDVAYVTGELQVLSADEVTERLPRTSLLPSQFQGFDRQPVLLATEAIPAE